MIATTINSSIREKPLFSEAGRELAWLDCIATIPVAFW
jgi:hypothetical protein